MTLSTTNSVAIYQGNGATTVFPFNFNIPAAEDIVVSLQDAVTFQTLATLAPGSFLALGYGDPAGGTVTYPLSGSPLTSSVNIVIARTVAYTQNLDIENQGGFFPDTLEMQLDFIVMQIQQIAALVNRAVLVPVGQIPPQVDSLGFLTVDGLYTLLVQLTNGLPKTMPSDISDVHTSLWDNGGQIALVQP